MKKKNQDKKGKVSSLFLLAPLLAKYKVRLYLVMLSLIITSACVLSIGRIVKYLIDFGFVNSASSNLNLILGTFFVAVLILTIASYFRSSIINEVGEKVVNDLRQKIYKNVIGISGSFFEDNKIGDVISRLTVDTGLLYNIISNSISFALRNILLFFGGLIFLFVINAKLTFIAILLIFLAVVPIIFLGRKVKKLSIKSQEKIADLTSHIEESINGIKTIQAYNQEMKESLKFNDFSGEALKFSVKKIKIRALLISIVTLIAFSFVGLIIWLGSNYVVNNEMSAGSLSSFIFYSIISATSLAALGQVMGQLSTAAGACERLFKIVDVKSDVEDPKESVKFSKDIFLGKEKMKIEFNNVKFGYKNQQGALILNQFNLVIEDKEKVALIGPSGSGKSTILELLMRFFDVNNGSILINEIDIKDIKIKELRSFFSYISQDCFIFSGNVIENILYSNHKNKKREDVEKIIRGNEAFDFILNLPNGLDSFVGQKGVKLSGGERQRIAILRAMINESPILLLDEATSALDNKNEKLISDLINDFAKDKIVIMIAHRLSTIRDVDRIIFMKNGKVIEEGKHKELVTKDGFYKELLDIGIR